MLIHHLKKNEKTSIQFLVYTFVGGLSFVIDFAALWFFTSVVGIYYLYSAIIAFALGLAINYVLSITLVFNVRKFQQKHLEFFLFTLIGVIGLAINEFILWFCSNSFCSVS